ncbi:GNAT family acetyltransferase [Corynebacterium macginleyi]|uniref:GNAT family N-acetyltransferase n=1 Tax=Corynebacterium macginleyi TaxID=38290 RepID=UPI00190DB1B3|nr:GNAT family N-acetyltransferase [Corynebacterium macginleyi]MBK4141842.1 GNAT family acetyltransferase [Corynebacterium macginleyi]
MHLVQVARPTQIADAEPADCIRSFVFWANLAAQEASGDAAASTSASRVVHRLQGSGESQTYLFTVVDGPSTLGPVSELGLPQISATAPSPELDYVGFIHISLPLLEERNTAEMECVLCDLPLPGEPLDAKGLKVATWMGNAALKLIQQLGRTIAHVGLLHPPDTAPEYDAMAEVYQSLGFTQRHSERQLAIDIPEQPVAALFPPGLSAAVWRDYDIPGEHIDDVMRLLTVASADADTGTLSAEPIVWSRQRLEEAHQRLQSRRGHTLLVALLDDADDILALTELARHEASDPKVCEWTLTVTDRDHRRQGLAQLAKLTALHEVNRAWPQVRRCYCSVAAGAAAMNALYARLGAREISQSSAWELRL